MTDARRPAAAPVTAPPSAAAEVSAPVPPDPDAAAMLAVASGDQQALRRLIDRWQNPLINFFYRSLHSYETAEDLAQVTFVRIYRAAGRYRPEARFSTYLFQVARRLLINEFRRQGRKPLDTVDPEELGGSVSGRAPLERMEIEEAFREALAQLPENHRSALLLRKQQELSYEEIAAAMDTSVSSVKTWIHRARARLKELLVDFAPGP